MSIENPGFVIFEKIDIRIGTVLSVKKNVKARKPSLIIEVDFGNEIGIKDTYLKLYIEWNNVDLMIEAGKGMSCNKKEIHYMCENENIIVNINSGYKHIHYQKNVKIVTIHYGLI